MHIVLKADKDTYITDRVVGSTRRTGANVGAAGSLDLFKLYDVTRSGSVPNVELSRLLVHFDMGPLRDAASAGLIDPGNGSFRCTLHLSDVYAGQPCPAGFTVSVAPLSRSFDEGFGRDVVWYGHEDVANFLTSSLAHGPWIVSGCGGGGGLPGSVDYVTASAGALAGVALTSSQLFVTGEEDLQVDVTRVVSATLAGYLPDEGFRISLDAGHEADQRTYFVKRFASRTAFDEERRPRLVVRFDDSVQDDALALFMDSPMRLFLFNAGPGGPANILSGALQAPVTGSSCLLLNLAVPVSGGQHVFTFTGSQHTRGTVPVAGTYSASVFISSTHPVVRDRLSTSGSLRVTPIWSSLDGSVGYHTGSALTFGPPRRAGSVADRRLLVSVHGIPPDVAGGEVRTARITLLDAAVPAASAPRLPFTNRGTIVRDIHWQARDLATGEVPLPFDTITNSTRASTDADGGYFTLDASTLVPGRNYTIDIALVVGATTTVYRSASPSFRVTHA